MPIPQTPENLVLQAVMDEFEENREKGNLTAEILNKEKVIPEIFKIFLILFFKSLFTIGQINNLILILGRMF